MLRATENYCAAQWASMTCEHLMIRNASASTPLASEEGKLCRAVQGQSIAIRLARRRVMAVRGNNMDDISSSLSSSMKQALLATAGLI